MDIDIAAEIGKYELLVQAQKERLQIIDQERLNTINAVVRYMGILDYMKELQSAQEKGAPIHLVKDT